MSPLVYATEVDDGALSGHTRDCQPPLDRHNKGGSRVAVGGDVVPT